MTETNSGHGGRKASSLTRSVYVAAAAVVLALVATVVLVADLASREADRFALRAEKNMIRLEFENQRDIAVREQAEISYWDDAVEALVRRDTPDPELVTEEMRDWVAADFGFSILALVHPDSRLAVAIVNGQTATGVTDLSFVQENAGLVDKARQLYRARRIGTAKGYRAPALRGGMTVPGIHAAEFVLHDNIPGIATAQVIVPDGPDLSVQDGQEFVLVGFKPFTAARLGEMAERLAIFEPGITAISETVDAPPHLVVEAGDGRPVFVFTWRPRAPRPYILRGVTPFATLLCLITILALVYIVRRHGKTLSALAESEAANRFMAKHDALTGLANRFRFDEEIESRADRKGGRPFAVACIDLDRFKPVNDTWGHHAGDEVLKTVAARFAKRVGGHGFVARTGGDEFMAIIETDLGDDDLKWLGDGLVEDASQPVVFQGVDIRIGASVGIAKWPDHGHCTRELIAAADALLYEGKNSGRGRAIVAAPALSPDSDGMFVEIRA